MSNRVFTIKDRNLFAKEIFEQRLEKNPIYYLDFLSGTKTPAIQPIYRNNNEFSGNGYPFFHVSFKMSDLKTKYGQLLGDDNDYIYAHFVGLIKVDQAQKDAGQYSMPYIYHTSPGDGWTSPVISTTSNSTKYVYFHISQYIADWYTDASDLQPNDKIHFACYHLPISITTGLAYIKNILVYLSTDPNLKLPVYVEPEVETGVLKTFKGVQILPSLNNIIGNGQFKNKQGIENEWGSYGVYKIQYHQDNPLQDISPFVLEQYSGANGEYEVHPRSGQSIQNTTYNMYIWHKQDPTFDGSTQIMHSQWWYDDGTNNTTSGAGTTIQKYNGYVLRQESFTPDSNKTPTGSYAWYIGYPTGGSNQNAKRYLTGQMVIPHPYDVHPLTYFEGVKPAQTLEYRMELFDNFTIYFKVSDISRYNKEDKTLIGMQSADKSQYINIFFGWGIDFYVGNHTSRTQNRLANFSYTTSDEFDFFITKQGNTLKIRAYKENSLYYEQTVTNDNFLFDVNYIRIGRGYGNQDSDSTLQKQIFQHFAQYNKVLTDTEMDDIVNPKTLRFKKIFINNKIKEFSFITDDQFYNPLNSQAYDGPLKPVNSSNQIVTKEGTFVGLDKTNLQGNFASWSAQRSPRKYVKTPYGWGFEYRSGQLSSTWSGNSYGYIFKDLTVTAGSKYTFQAWCYVSHDCDIDRLPLFHEQQISGTPSVNYDMNKKGTWQLLISHPTAQGDGTARFLVYPQKYGLTDGSFEGYFIITQPIIVQAEYLTEFGGSYDSISCGNLDFNLYDSIGLKWNQPYTILVWQKPYGTHTDDLNGYSIFSMGCNSNSVGGKYLWFGKEKGSNTFRVGGSGGSNYISGVQLDPNKWFNNWIFTQITSNGTDITIRYYNKTKMFEHTVTYSDMPENGFVNQYGYDLSLSGWDNVNTCPKVVRDLIVFKRELSLEEIENIYYSHLRLGKMQQKITEELFEIE